MKDLCIHYCDVENKKCDTLYFVDNKPEYTQSFKYSGQKKVTGYILEITKELRADKKYNERKVSSHLILMLSKCNDYLTAVYSVRSACSLGWRTSYYLLRRKPNGFPKSFIPHDIFLKFTATTPSAGALAVILKRRKY